MLFLIDYSKKESKQQSPYLASKLTLSVLYLAEPHKLLSSARITEVCSAAARHQLQVEGAAYYRMQYILR